MTTENCRDIYDGHALKINGRDNFEGAQDWFDFWRDLRLQRSHNYVLSALLAPARFVKHAE